MIFVLSVLKRTSLQAAKLDINFYRMINSLFRQYPEILESKGYKIDDCEVHHFQFDGLKQNTFHLRIMEEKLNGLIHDTHNSEFSSPSVTDPFYRHVFITLLKGDTKINRIKEIATSLGGIYHGVAPWNK